MITRISIKDTATYDNEGVDTDNLIKIEWDERGRN